MPRSHLEVFIFSDRCSSAQFHRVLSRKGSAQRELQMIVLHFSPASMPGEIWVWWMKCSTARWAAVPSNSLLYYQHVDPQKTNSTAKGFSANLQPLYAVANRSRRKIPTEKIDEDGVSSKFVPHCQWCLGINKSICLTLVFLALHWGSDHREHGITPTQGPEQLPEQRPFSTWSEEIKIFFLFTARTAWSPCLGCTPGQA